MTIAVPTSVATIPDLLRVRAAEQPHDRAYTFLGEDGSERASLTYAQLEQSARRIAAALQESRAQSERVLLLYPPGLEYIAAFYGCLMAGAIAVPAYPPRQNRHVERLEAILRDADARLILTSDAIAAKLDRFDCLSTDALPDAPFRDVSIAPDDVAFLQYTSGSTSMPKGVRVTHANLLHNEEAIRRAFRVDPSSVVVGWLPLYHDMGLIGNVLQPLYAGATSILMSPVAFLQRPMLWLESIARYRGTISGGPNFAYELVARAAREEETSALDLSSWRLAFNGAEPVRAETMERFSDAFARCGFRREAFYPCYGLAEATLFVSGGSSGCVDDGRVSCGVAGAGIDVRIVDAGGNVAADGHVGEIVVAGPSVAAGYWRRPEESAETFGARIAGDSRPWLRTGDLGVMRGGELFVAGRIKDLIIIRGRNHYPQDIERTVERAHAALRAGGGAAFAIEPSPGAMRHPLPEGRGDLKPLSRLREREGPVASGTGG
jgi:acyl-CoA synthetase (AMP-forming)/AMP-acid ligase II